jgi:c(7)-type cytochrome triheme protein
MMIRFMINRLRHPVLWSIPLMVVLLVAWPMDALFSQPEEILIENQILGHRNSRSGVFFPHELHMDSLDCLTCHHVFENGENTLEEDEIDDDGSASCRNCHDSSTAINLEMAYHRQCISCHRDLNRNLDNDLPITCKDCHPKK